MPLKKPKADDCWSLSLRGHCIGDDGSSDESDNDDAPSQPMPASEESRLLGELDLASRADAATYKPNPWSIARANAATRTTLPSTAVPVKPHRPKNANANASVLEMLRKQARKPPTSECQPAGPPMIARKLPSAAVNLVPRLPQSHAVSCSEDDAHIPSDETLVDEGYQPHVLHKRAGDDFMRPLITSLDSGHNALSGTGAAVSASTGAQPGELIVRQASSRHAQVRGRPSPTVAPQHYDSVHIDAQPHTAHNALQHIADISERETTTTPKCRPPKGEGGYSFISPRDAIAGRLSPHSPAGTELVTPLRGIMTFPARKPQ
ncbi:hypothetical protein ONZ51_g8543 [Trametes cubensis]|uniref:Uncharacterized protein n=1 Tax=Trametes cubensis TaxID=1111947 RepID=A0AAD7TNE0_9APHY|nr:hypothetical protein ONZ51_g8543 [Trametes cubensis]